MGHILSSAIDFLFVALAVVSLLAGFAAIVRWVRRGFWVPRYVHGLAIGAFVAGILLGYQVLADGSPKADTTFGVLVALFLVLVLPALIYFFFVFYGGADAANERRSQPRDDEPIEPSA